MDFNEFFAQLGKEQATMAELLDAGFTGRELLKATRDGVLKRGVCGYWLPKDADPGFVTVMNRHRKNYNTNEES